MTIEGVDCSWGRPGGAALVAAGKHFVLRYVPLPGDTGHGLTKAEVVDYHGHGLGIGMCFETTMGRALQGSAAGKADAQACITNLAPLGFPTTRPIYFAVDTDVNPTQWPAIDAYFGGARSVLGLPRIGAYAEYDVLSHLHDVGLASWFWQPAAIAWDEHRLLIDGWGHIRQYRNGQTINGETVDFDRAFRTDFGQWEATGDDVNNYPVPKAPSQMMIATGKTLYHTSDCNTTSGDKIVSPGRNMPYYGQPVAGVYAVEYVDDHGAHSGQAWFTKQPGVVTPIPTPTPDCSVAVAAATAPLNAQIAAQTTTIATQQNTIASQASEITALEGQVATAKADGRKSYHDDIVAALPQP